jgi:hypothetical protein
MDADEPDAAHSRKVAVERPNLCVVVGGNRCDQKVSETETLTCRTSEVKPIIEARPRLIRWKENRKRREYATEARIVTIGRAAQNLDANWSRKRNVAGVE